MCGRYANDVAIDDMMRVFGAEPGTAFDWVLAYSIAPTDEAPIVRERRTDEALVREIDRATWGLRPSWSKGGGPRPVNARLETAASNGLFRKSFMSWRCLVPMAGYFEWESTPSGKQPYYLYGEGPLAAAGLYAPRRDESSGEWSLTFTILTREARDASGEVHDRMPVFVQPDLWGGWLAPDVVADAERMTARLAESSEAVAQTVAMRAVSRRINSAQSADPADATLVAPVT